MSLDGKTIVRQAKCKGFVQLHFLTSWLKLSVALEISTSCWMFTLTMFSVSTHNSRLLLVHLRMILLCTHFPWSIIFFLTHYFASTSQFLVDLSGSTNGLSFSLIYQRSRKTQKASDC